MAENVSNQTSTTTVPIEAESTPTSESIRTEDTTATQDNTYESETAPSDANSLTIQTAESVINKYGIIRYNFTRLRKEASTSSDELLQMSKGTRVKVLKQVTGEMESGSDVWYQIELISSSQTGYIAQRLIEVTNEEITAPSPVDPSDDFESYLTQQGFPESYRPALRALHAKYPSWVFTASHPKNSDGSAMKWNTVIAYENSLERKNSIPSSYSVAQRSFAKGAYNYKTNTWYYSDAGFYYASPEIIAYYLDPRNFLNEKDIFQFENLAYNPDIHTREEIVQSLKNTFMADGPTVPVVDQNGNSSDMKYPDIFIKAAEWSQANPIFLAERAIQEVGRQGSDSVSGTVAGYENIYNFYNIGAYAGTNPIMNGLQYAKYGYKRVPGSLTNTERDLYLLPWNNRYLSIVGGARWISEGYINAGQNTSYYQKWNIDHNHTYGPWWHQYMGNVIAPTVEGRRVYASYQERGQLNKVREFIIPVIADMPAKTAAFPSDNRSRNNWLQSITVSSGILKPAFNPDVNNYSVVVAQGVEKFTVNAKAYHDKCNIKGIGVYNLKHGENTIKVQALSERGDVKDYYITVTREGTAQPGDPSTKPAAEMTSTTLDIGTSYVTNAAPEAGKNTVEYLTKNLKLPDGYKLVITVDGKKVDSGIVGTGTK
ncbi:MAG: SH3 domain-containing protein, partial [Fastidiosipila sp.]|nr:SH3 domain-containing protein [Fastidiosipila sp.]